MITSIQLSQEDIKLIILDILKLVFLAFDRDFLGNNCFRKDFFSFPILQIEKIEKNKAKTSKNKTITSKK